MGDQRGSRVGRCLGCANHIFQIPAVSSGKRTGGDERYRAPLNSSRKVPFERGELERSQTAYPVEPQSRPVPTLPAAADSLHLKTPLISEHIDPLEGETLAQGSAASVAHIGSCPTRCGPVSKVDVRGTTQPHRLHSWTRRHAGEVRRDRSETNL